MPNSGSRWRIVVLSYGRAGKYYRTGFWFCFFKALYWLLSQYKHLACENWPEWPLRASARLSFYESWSQTKWIRWDHQCQGPLGTVGTYFTGKLTSLFQRATAFSSWRLSCLKEILCHQFLRISVTYLNIQWIGPRNYIFLKKIIFLFVWRFKKPILSAPGSWTCFDIYDYSCQIKYWVRTVHVILC